MALTGESLPHYGSGVGFVRVALFLAAVGLLPRGSARGRQVQALRLFGLRVSGRNHPRDCRRSGAPQPAEPMMSED